MLTKDEINNNDSFDIPLYFTVICVFCFAFFLFLNTIYCDTDVKMCYTDECKEMIVINKNNMILVLVRIWKEILELVFFALVYKIHKMTSFKSLKKICIIGSGNWGSTM